MFGTLDHVGFIVRDLDAAVAEAQEVLGLPIARTVSLPDWGLHAALIGDGAPTLELFTLANGELLEQRLAGADRRIDHIAFKVADLDALMLTLSAAGARFTGPDRRDVLRAPVRISATRHLWTVPESSAGLAMQFFEDAAD